jgi:hypothetical protein
MALARSASGPLSPHIEAFITFNGAITGRKREYRPISDIRSCAVE